jgi:hypothetical protein
MLVYLLSMTTLKTLLMLCCLMAMSSPLVSAAPKSQSLTVIGEIESVTLEKEKFQLLGRIDTDAETSSITALKIERYERDGKKWVRFEVPNTTTKKRVLFERPLTRVASIKRHGAPPVDRPVVSLLVSIGEIECSCEFSLTDRSSYEFPVLIGRNFLSGRAVVDVSHKHITHPSSQGKSSK